LRNFKSCHGLGELKIYGEKLSADRKEGSDLDFVYNVDEAGLVWNSWKRRLYR
ncbi:hypothetical protein T4B_9157, partial [Trichinella pseudospiralis]